MKRGVLQQGVIMWPATIFADVTKHSAEFRQLKRLQPTFHPSPSLEHSSQTTRPQLRQWCFEASEVKTVSQRRPCPSCAVQNGRWHSCRVETSRELHHVSPINGVVIWWFIHSTLACIIYTYRDTVPSDLGIREVWAGSPDPTPVDPHETCRREVNWKCLSVSYQLLTLPKQLVSEPEYTLSAFLYFKDNYLFTQILGHLLFTSSLPNFKFKKRTNQNLFRKIVHHQPKSSQRSAALALFHLWGCTASTVRSQTFASFACLKTTDGSIQMGGSGDKSSYDMTSKRCFYKYNI